VGSTECEGVGSTAATVDAGSEFTARFWILNRRDKHESLGSHRTGMRMECRRNKIELELNFRGGEGQV
jgi:hypothetical protein